MLRGSARNPGGLRRGGTLQGYPPGVGYVIVFVVAAAVGVGVYAVTLREGLQPIPGFSDTDPLTPAAPGGSYVSVTGGRPDWQSRLTGLFGLMVAVVLGAAALAAILYASISAVIRILGHLAPSGGASSGP